MTRIYTNKLEAFEAYDVLTQDEFDAYMLSVCNEIAPHEQVYITHCTNLTTNLLGPIVGRVVSEEEVSIGLSVLLCTSKLWAAIDNMSTAACKARVSASNFEEPAQYRALHRHQFMMRFIRETLSCSEQIALNKLFTALTYTDPRAESLWVSSDFLPLIHAGFNDGILCRSPIAHVLFLARGPAVIEDILDGFYAGAPTLRKAFVDMLSMWMTSAEMVEMSGRNWLGKKLEVWAIEVHGKAESERRRVFETGWMRGGDGCLMSEW